MAWRKRILAISVRFVFRSFTSKRHLVPLADDDSAFHIDAAGSASRLFWREKKSFYLSGITCCSTLTH